MRCLRPNMSQSAMLPGPRIHAGVLGRVLVPGSEQDRQGPCPGGVDSLAGKAE